MISVQTQRLTLIALPLAEFELFLDNQPQLAERLGLVPDALQIEKAFWEEGVQDMRSYSLPKLAENSDRYELYTVWLIVLNEANRMVGGIGVAGEPNEAGESIIGYFVDERYEGRGIATEATKAMTAWALQLPAVKSVIAYTLADGIASQKVLQKSGFVADGIAEDGNPRWRYIKV